MTEKATVLQRRLTRIPKIAGGPFVLITFHASTTRKKQTMACKVFALIYKMPHAGTGIIVDMSPTLGSNPRLQRDNQIRRVKTLHRLSLMECDREGPTHLVLLRADFQIRHNGIRVKRVERARAVLAELEPVGLVAAVIVCNHGEGYAPPRHRQRFPSRIAKTKAGQRHTHQRDVTCTEHHHGVCVLLSATSARSC